MPGGLTARGTHLLKDLSEAGIISDFTRLADEAFSPVLEIFDGLIGASQRSWRASVRGGPRGYSESEIEDYHTRHWLRVFDRALLA